VLRRLSRSAARVIVAALVVIVSIIGIGIAALETTWAKGRIRDLIVHQANEYLTATLAIGGLEGSILRGIQLHDIRLSQDGRELVSIDELALSYSVKELVQSGTVIKRIRLVKPVINLSRLPDGRWDLAGIVKREQRDAERAGPSRPITAQLVEVIDGRVQVHGPLDFGAAHAPTGYGSLNASFSFEYVPVRWRLALASVSFDGHEPDLSLTKLSGALGNGPGGWLFEKLTVETPRTTLVLDGRVSRSDAPTRLGLTATASRFAFQEWSGVLPGLKNIAVEGPLQTTLSGPLSQLVTDVEVEGTGGSATGRVTLDTTVPGWRAAGTVELKRLNLARWLNRADRPSEITGKVTFDLALELGRHFPRGVFNFAGPRASYMNFSGDDVKAQGQITEKEVRIARASATAYSASVETHDSSIGLDSPFPFRFQGTAARIDLRNVPSTVPVPRVESALTFDYDVTGRFVEPFIAGRATFARSTFLGVSIADGTRGTIDTSQEPIVYSGEGDIANARVDHIGRGFDVEWMQDLRYAGTLAGHFRVDGRGFDKSTMLLTVGGRITHGEIFGGEFTNAEISLSIHDGTLAASYSGDFASLDPAVPLGDDRFHASLNGNGTASLTAHDLLLREVTIADYEIAGALTTHRSTIHGIDVERAQIAATVHGGLLSVTNLEVSGATVQGKGSGTLALDDRQPSAFSYQVDSADLTRLESLTGLEAGGLVSSTGRMTGPWAGLHLVGNGSIAQLDAFDVKALVVEAKYDAALDIGRPRDAVVTLDGHATLLTIASENVEETSGTVSMSTQQLRIDLRVQQSAQRSGTISGVARLRLDEGAIDVSDVVVGLGKAPWRLASSGGPVVVHWDRDGVTVTPTTFVGGNGDERINISGSWRADGSGALRLTASHVFLDTFQSAFDRPTRYGGVLDADLTIRGTRARPVASGTLSIVNGRVERVAYQKLAGRIDYVDEIFSIDLRLDQSSSVWITAAGTVPMALFDDRLMERPIDLTVKSSGINLGLVEGLTSQVTNVNGELRIDVHAIGTSGDPHFAGNIAIDRAEFQVARTGARYRNGRAELALTTDRIAVTMFRLEDSGGRPLEVRGSLGTHELAVGDLEAEISSSKFEILRNEFGRLSLDTALQVRGRAESPQITGELTISSGDVKVDEILQRTLFQPYAVEETAITPPPPTDILNPWELLNLNLTLHVPNTLRLTGDNVQITQGTPIGLGNINLRVAGDLYLYKDAKQPLYVTGSFDSVSGTYAFQGRRFDVDPSSAIVFRGDLDPELYIGVTRLISGVQTRVGVIGPMRKPELRLTSNPPLDESDILSLIVFNTSTNQLSSAQQQELVVRAGALAAGFLATPIISAISSEIGLDVLQVEPGNDLTGGVGAKVTVGQEIAPGLVAQFSRQFGSEPYDEATVEYYLSRIIRLRGTFSDAQTLNARSPFRRVERAGIDLLFFFSF
jgi:autotransporter translocation and assembly factor TamB